MSLRPLCCKCCKMTVACQSENTQETAYSQSCHMHTHTLVHTHTHTHWHNYSSLITRKHRNLTRYPDQTMYKTKNRHRYKLTAQHLGETIRKKTCATLNFYTQPKSVILKKIFLETCIALARYLLKVQSVIFKSVSRCVCEKKVEILK